MASAVLSDVHAADGADTGAATGDTFRDFRRIIAPLSPSGFARAAVRLSSPVLAAGRAPAPKYTSLWYVWPMCRRWCLTKEEEQGQRKNPLESVRVEVNKMVYPPNIHMHPSLLLSSAVVFHALATCAASTALPITNWTIAADAVSIC